MPGISATRSSTAKRAATSAIAKSRIGAITQARSRGAALGRPDLIERLRRYGAGALPATGMAGAIASLKVADRLVPERRAIVADLRDETSAWLASRGCPSLPSEANMLLVDVGRPGPSFAADMLRLKVVVGRTWPSHPNHIRVTIGTPEEMSRFREAFDRVRA